jgi:hypothetical protein
MWQLMMTNPAKEWVEAGNFETVTAAAGCIREMEGYPVTGGIDVDGSDGNHSGIWSTKAAGRSTSSNAG